MNTAPETPEQRAKTHLEYATFVELKAAIPGIIELAIASVSEEFPGLTSKGWPSCDIHSAGGRKPFDCEEVRTALCFIRDCVVPQSTINSAADSGRLKHDAERWGRGNRMAAHISNGAFIVAAIIAGFQHARYAGSARCCTFNMRLGDSIRRGAAFT